MDAYEIFHVQDPATAEASIEVVENVYGDVHGWLPDEDRGEWIVRRTAFYVVFLGGVYRGFFCFVSHGDETYLHFGSVGETLSYRDVVFGLGRAQCIARNVYGISELFCEIDDGGIVHKLIDKLGFEPTEQMNTYSIKYYGQET